MLSTGRQRSLGCLELASRKPLKSNKTDLGKADECSRRLAKISGVGPIGAALLMMKTPAPEIFDRGGS